MIAVIDFGMGNIHSCLKAISLYTNDFKLTTDPRDLETATGIILPGDGAFEKAMFNLGELGFLDSIRGAIEKKIPLFGICIGFQILFEDSEESTVNDKLVTGLGLIKGHVRKFRLRSYKVPHMGWNKMIFNNKKKSRLLEEVQNGEYMYFIHSYRPVDADPSAITASCNYAEEKFPVIVEKENIFGTQFHPEKSDKEGLKILRNFIRIANPN
ncbi:MAG: imidazole glycerol phosphate synthase subunit HisH [Leptospiraceae bacterium]|nr:imidazole glycerol phosphate synthase subunit HisH [Leptospiraceae bacterium]